jgi:hypothetical protein
MPVERGGSARHTRKRTRKSRKCQTTNTKAEIEALTDANQIVSSNTAPQRLTKKRARPGNSTGPGDGALKKRHIDTSQQARLITWLQNRWKSLNLIEQGTLERMETEDAALCRTAYNQTALCRTRAQKSYIHAMLTNQQGMAALAEHKELIAAKNVSTAD